MILAENAVLGKKTIKMGNIHNKIRNVSGKVNIDFSNLQFYTSFG